MAAVMVYEKSVRKQIVAPQLQATYGDKADKAAAVEVTDFLLHLNARRMVESIAALSQKLAYLFGDDERNRALAHRMLASTFHDDDA